MGGHVHVQVLRVDFALQAFWDQTGGLWAGGNLAGKYAGVFVSTATPGGGQGASYSLSRACTYTNSILTATQSLLSSTLSLP